MEVNGYHGYHGYHKPTSSQHLFLCSAEERNPYRFWTTWGWVNYTIFSSGWPIFLSHAPYWILTMSSSESHHNCTSHIAYLYTKACTTPVTHLEISVHHAHLMAMKHRLQDLLDAVTACKHQGRMLVWAMPFSRAQAQAGNAGDYRELLII